MYFALAAVTFGLVAGLKPGPLGVFVIHQTMSRGYLAGFKSSLAPLLTDGPIIALALLLSLQLNDIRWFIALISILGAFYLAYIAFKIFTSPSGINPSGKNDDEQSSLLAAVKINALNPSPYIFWLTIGSSYILMGTKTEATVFILCAICTLCVTKFGVALALKKLGEQFNPRIYSLMIKSLTLPLLVFSIQLFHSGLTAWPF